MFNKIIFTEVYTFFVNLHKEKTPVHYMDADVRRATTLMLIRAHLLSHKYQRPYNGRISEPELPVIK